MQKKPQYKKSMCVNYTTTVWETFFFYLVQTIAENLHLYAAQNCNIEPLIPKGLDPLNLFMCEVRKLEFLRL